MKWLYTSPKIYIPNKKTINVSISLPSIYFLHQKCTNYYIKWLVIDMNICLYSINDKEGQILLKSPLSIIMPFYKQTLFHRYTTG
ncbi:hypothetical protein FHS57_004146 [Runella defluvii]|uniref:Uncharacterized protein n=1 Tax=Runella defluvii TaxID=370973 RepID=A0A7W6ES09_9BACT|nr:hypothetical protein [Runella defluvii]